MPRHALITSAEVACAVGSDLQSAMSAVERRASGLRPLAGLLPGSSRFGSLLGGWIADRSLMQGRRYGAASNVAVHVARQAIERAGWTAEQRRAAWIFVGSSRGNAGELLHAWPERRPIARYKASNLMHSEIAAALSIELGVQGPWHVLSNGCASGLDALGFASTMIASGAAPRVLAVAVDLPLIEELLAAFDSTGALSKNNVNDPYSPEATGFFPSEAAVAVTLESSETAANGWCTVEGYSVTSDAYDSVGVQPGSPGVRACLENALASAGEGDRLRAICPHATGTAANAQAEAAALRATTGDLPAILLKPYTGHALGASGLLESALLAGFLHRGTLPLNLPGLTSPAGLRELDPTSLEVTPGDAVLKLSVGMGGHNAALVLRKSFA